MTLISVSFQNWANNEPAPSPHSGEKDDSTVWRFGSDNSRIVWRIGNWLWRCMYLSNHRLSRIETVFSLSWSCVSRPRQFKTPDDWQDAFFKTHWHYQLVDVMQTLCPLGVEQRSVDQTRSIMPATGDAKYRSRSCSRSLRLLPWPHHSQLVP